MCDLNFIQVKTVNVNHRIGDYDKTARKMKCMNEKKRDEILETWKGRLTVLASFPWDCGVSF